MFLVKSCLLISQMSQRSQVHRIALLRLMSKRPSLNSLITLLKRSRRACLVGGGEGHHPRERLRGCRGSLHPRLITYHGLASSLVPHCPRICPTSVLPCCQLLETRPPSKFPAGGAPQWQSRAEPVIPASSRLRSDPTSISSIPSVPSSCCRSPAPQGPLGHTKRFFRSKVWCYSHQVQTCLRKESFLQAAQNFCQKL